jgi:hypothetical protein
MAKRRFRTSAATIKRKIKAGYGQGEGIHYKPYLPIQHVTSNGLVSRIKGNKIQRIYHLMSQLETRFFHVFEWDETVIDIREQYPLLPQKYTLDLAEQCGVRHPVHPITRHPIVMTCDFLLTVKEGYKTKLIARTIKPSGHMHKKRVLEKFEIERRFWLLRSIDWKILTEKDLPLTLAKNLNLLRNYYDLTDRLNGQAKELPAIKATLTAIARRNPHLPLIQLAQTCDTSHSLPVGTSLAVAYHLLYTHQWLANLDVPLDPARPVASLRVQGV